MLYGEDIFVQMRKLDGRENTTIIHCETKSCCFSKVFGYYDHLSMQI